MADEVIVERHRGLGVLRLNRPKALNSLTLTMVRLMREALNRFASDPEIVGVLVYGEGERGFCAGGDIRALYDGRGTDQSAYRTFWREEYALNASIARFPKLYIAVMDGVAMGGGVGVSVHGNRRIVTERTRLAMPETRIGFIPDVGGSWLLSRCGGIGVYLALSGTEIGADDAISLGLADHRIRSEAAPELIRELTGATKREHIDEIIGAYAEQTSAQGALTAHRAMFDRVMTLRSPRAMIDALRNEALDLSLRAADAIEARSPTSLCLTHKLLEAARRASRLEDCLENEFKAACSLLRTHDLYEGVRAVIIDKDQRPQWRPATLEEVDDRVIAELLRGPSGLSPLFS